jgi:hypothetical protein
MLREAMWSPAMHEVIDLSGCEGHQYPMGFFQLGEFETGIAPS